MPGSSEDVHFAQSFRIVEKEGAGIAGYPIFLGLEVGEEGIFFKGFTVNVKNIDDEKALSFLESDTFTSGLTLLKTSNPAIAPLSDIVTGLVKGVLSRNINRPVQDFYLGLDFTKVQTRARLCQGSYVVVQVPNVNDWDWDLWKFKPTTGMIHDSNGVQIPYNYLVFSISKYGE